MPDNWVRTVATLKTGAEFRKAIFWSAILIFIFGLIPLAVGYIANSQTEVSQFDFWVAPFSIVNELLIVESIGFFGVSLLFLLLGSAVLTTIDTILITIGQVMLDAGLCVKKQSKGAQSRPTVVNAIIFIPVFSMASSFIVSQKNILLTAFLLCSYCVFLMPFILLSVFLEKHCNDFTGCASIIMATIISSVTILVEKRVLNESVLTSQVHVPIFTVFVCASISILISILLSKLFRR